ncbi:MAG TPA: hypothetical protein VK845_00690 [Gemmatimonadales bacterium]|nr:hypothetical protein [Gemmatimonadales bacterium]
MSTTLTAIAVVTVGYILAYLLFDRLRDRFGYVGGAEYVVIGFLLGPHAARLLDAQVVQELTPIVSLALGWLGMLLGTYFRLPAMALLDSAHVKIAFTEAVSTFVLALAALLPIFHYVVGYGWVDAPIPAVTLAAVATLSAPAAIDAFARKGFGTSPVFPVVQLVARIDALIGVVAFGLVLAILHRGDVAPTVRQPTATEWAVINIAVGVASGVLFHLFLGPREREPTPEDDSRLFVALAGAIVIASGAAYYLNLSPIFTNLVLGFILANTGNAHRDVSRLLARTERPVFLALLIFAGAAWSASAPELWFIAPAFIGIRLTARYLGGRFAGTVAAPPNLRTPELGRALLAQGGFGVAIAVNYTQVHPDLDPNIVLTTTLVSILLFEVVASAETSAVLAHGAAPRPEPPPPPPPSPAEAPQPAGAE